MWDGYTTARWRRLRAQILRRDGYRCRESLRYGRKVEASYVHHVWPAEDYPEYAWCPWNLISLSKSSHEAMHDRVTHKLTPLGESWRRRVSPPGISSRFRAVCVMGREGFPTEGGKNRGGVNEIAETHAGADKRDAGANDAGGHEVHSLAPLI